MKGDANAYGSLRFLSIQAQDFIEDDDLRAGDVAEITFLSIQAQDFIEESTTGAER